MKTIISLFILSLFTSVSVHAEPAPISYHAVCNGQGFYYSSVKIEWSGVFKWPTTARSDAGPTTLKITNNSNDKVLLDLSTGNQKFFRQTEAGISFFGKYENATFTNPNQTVYVVVIYDSITSIYEWMRQIKLGKNLYDVLNSTEFKFQTFAEEDPNSTLSLQFKCNFVVE